MQTVKKYCNIYPYLNNKKIAYSNTMNLLLTLKLLSKPWFYLLPKPGVANTVLASVWSTAWTMCVAQGPC